MIPTLTRSRGRRIVPALLSLLALLGALALTSTANGAVLTNERQPISGIAFSECSGEFIDFTGTSLGQFGVTQTPTGSLHVESKFDEHGSGVGRTSGARYLFNFTDSSEVNVGPNSTQSSIGNASLISQGNVPNRKLQFTLHITVNANGEVTVFIDTFTIKCT